MQYPGYKTEGVKFPGYKTDYECSVEIGCGIQEMLQACRGKANKITYPPAWKGWPTMPPFFPHPSVVDTRDEYNPNVDVMVTVDALRFIEHTKEGLEYYRAHKTRNRERQAGLEKTYRYKLDYARNHYKSIPEPKTDDDIAYYSQQLGVSGPYADAVTAYRERKGTTETIEKLNTRIVNAKRNLKVCRGMLLKTLAHIEKNKAAWGISDAQCQALIDHDQGNIDKYETELAELTDELNFLQGSDAQVPTPQPAATKSTRADTIKAGFKMYTGPFTKKTKRPKLRPFRAHIGLSDLRMSELREFWASKQRTV